MKIVISAEGPDLTAQVAHRFGTSPYLIIVDTQTMAFEAGHLLNIDKGYFKKKICSGENNGILRSHYTNSLYC